MKRYIRSDSYQDTMYNVSWYSQFGDQNGACIKVPADYMYDPYSYIERTLIGEYGDEYGGVADYMPVDIDDQLTSLWDEGYEPIESSMTEEDFVKSATDLANINWEITRSKPWAPYDTHQNVWHTLYINGEQIGYVYDWQRDGDYGYSVYVGNDDGDERPRLVGEYKELQKAKDRLELEYNRAKGLIDKFSVTSDTDIDDDDDWEWSPYSQGTYRVDGKRIVYTDDPEEAIRLWVEMQEEAPLDVAIMCKTKAQAIELLKHGTPEYLTQLYEEYPDYSPYKLEYLIEECQKKLAEDCKYFYEGQYGYGDQVHPFDVG